MKPEFKPRDVIALLKALELAEKVKPIQVARRIVFEKYGVSGSPVDRILTAIMYKVYRLQGILDKAAAKALNTTPENVASQPPLVRQLWRLSVYLAQFDQIGDERLKHLLLEHGLPYVAKKYGWRLARQAARIIKSLEKEPWKPETEAERLEAKYLVPSIIVESVSRLLPKDELEHLLAKLNTEPAAGLRVNTLKTSLDKVIKILEKHGITYQVSKRVENHLKYHAPFDEPIRQLVEKGLAVPQDEASAAAAPLLEPKPGNLILDLCAAPGGKTTHLAELTRLEATIIAFEIYRDRVRKLYELAQRTSTYFAIHILHGDAMTAPQVVGENRADRILLDPPCSSTGALAKHPDAKWRLTRKTLETLVERQKQFLKAAVKTAKPGALILYTVCSIMPEEGEYVVQWALENLPIELEPLNSPYDPSPLLPGTMRAWPHRHDTTGFFYALLRRK